jgi:FemAB-related protein (PEP-CTERM system-associated)
VIVPSPQCPHIVADVRVYQNREQINLIEHHQDLWHIGTEDHSGTSTMRLLRLDASQDRRWDAFVGQRTASVTDLSGWRHVVLDTYGIESHFFAVEDDDALVGTLGLFEIRHPFFGHYLTTAVFSNDGGFHYDNVIARDLLIAEARNLADETNADYLLLRSRGDQFAGFQLDKRYRTAIIDLSAGADAVWEKTLLSKTRNQVRRGIKEGFTIHTGSDQVADFYRVFSRHMRDLGSPAHSQKYYENIIRFLGNYVQFMVVKEGSELVAGAMLLQINGTATNYHTVALKQYNRRCPNYFLYWDMIKRSCERGNLRFDMGRSEDGSSNLKFKMNWGAQAVKLNYNYYLQTTSAIPYTDPHNPRYKWPIAIWKKLPLPITRSLGPYLISGIA